MTQLVDWIQSKEITLQKLEKREVELATAPTWAYRLLEYVESNLPISKMISRINGLPKKEKPKCVQMYPWINRLEYTASDFWDLVERQVREYYNFDGVHGDALKYFVISGGPGTGKTRTGLEIPNLLQDYCKSEGIELTSTFHSVRNWGGVEDDSWNGKRPAEDEKYEERMGKHFAVELIASVFGTEPSAVKNLSFVKRLDLVTALEVIKSYWGISSPKWVFLVQFDEFQSRETPLIHLLRKIRKLMDDQPKFCLLIPVLTGSAILHLQPDDDFGGYRPYLFRSKALSKKLSKKFVKNALSYQGRPDLVPTNDRTHRRFLSICGGVPRLLEFYVDALLKHDETPRDQNIWKKVLRQMLDDIHEKYHAPIESKNRKSPDLQLGKT